MPSSLPAWGVWIEIVGSGAKDDIAMSLPAWGVWIEIVDVSHDIARRRGHSPHGECGLKSLTPPPRFSLLPRSLPAWGVWIEIRQ